MRVHRLAVPTCGGLARQLGHRSSDRLRNRLSQHYLDAQPRDASFHVDRSRGFDTSLPASERLGVSGELNTSIARFTELAGYFAVNMTSMARPPSR
jgi:hypothetical protein